MAEEVVFSSRGSCVLSAFCWEGEGESFEGAPDGISSLLCEDIVA